MAKYKDDGMSEEQWHLDDGLPSTSEDSETPRKIQYPGEVVRTRSREELMECIKRGQRPTWVPNASFQALRDEEEALNAQRRLRATSRTSSPHNDDHNPLSAAAEVPACNEESEVVPPASSEPAKPLQRPPSALHRGDFSQLEVPTPAAFWTNPTYQPGLAISTLGDFDAPPPEWYSDSPRPSSLDAMNHTRTLLHLHTNYINRRRAPSLGSSSSFVMRAPTSPLVYATSNTDLFPSRGEISSHIPLRDNTRRRTMPPNSFHSFSITPIDATPPNFSRPFVPALRREASMPSSSHQTRRSLSSFTYHPRSNPQTPWGQSSRASMSSETSTRRRKSMVGSFEESLLRGRMSTPPSKPLDFVAQIGVMGKGDCPSSLKCPAHVAIAFPAVFYSYPASAGVRSVSDDTPSPYVGTIDLGQNLKPVTLAIRKGKRDPGLPKGIDTASMPPNQDDASKLHVGGAYRVPQQGQLQIIIKNPNKTAVKLFLIPYDLSGMDAATKTFVRQKSYSTGPIMESVLGEGANKAIMADPLENKQILRYLVHLKFCCPAKNRFYLHHDIRVVFANRVPDGKEKLRNEVQIPEPRFSVWKPLWSEQVGKTPKSAPSTPTINTFEFETPLFGDMEGFPTVHSPTSPTPFGDAINKSPPSDFQLVSSLTKSAAWNLSNHSPVAEKRPFEFPDVKQPQTPKDEDRPERALSPITGFGTTSSLRGSPVPWRSPSSNGNNMTRSFSPGPIEQRDSLLSKQLKQLNEPFHVPRGIESIGSEHGEQDEH